MANKVPEGFEEDEGPLNVELRPEEATLEDYEEVPIEVGLALGKTRHVNEYSEYGSQLRPIKS